MTSKKVAAIKTLSAPARRAKVISLVESGLVHSQSDLVARLKKDGIRVTQATASRDLEDIGALRGRSKDGSSMYQLPAGANALQATSIPGQLIISVESSANIAVIRTPPGGAQLLASALDGASQRGALSALIGTIAGDDTVLLISKKATGGAALAKQLRQIAQPGKTSLRKAGQ